MSARWKEWLNDTDSSIPAANMPTTGARLGRVKWEGVHLVSTCNGIAIQCRPRVSVGDEVEQVAEEDGWQEATHIACCSTSLPVCTQKKPLWEQSLWRYHADEQCRAVQSRTGPQQRRPVIGVATAVQRTSNVSRVHPTFLSWPPPASFLGTGWRSVWLGYPGSMPFKCPLLEGK